MRSLQHLKIVITYFFWYLMLAGIVQIALIIIPIVNHEWKIPLTILGQAIDLKDQNAWLILFFHFISLLIFIYAIYNLKIVINELSVVKIFEEKVSSGLYKAGNAILVCAMFGFFLGILMRVPNGVAPLPELTSTLNSVFFHLIIGLLLRVLGVVIKIAKGMKEENELTV